MPDESPHGQKEPASTGPFGEKMTFDPLDLTLRQLLALVVQRDIPDDLLATFDQETARYFLSMALGGIYDRLLQAECRWMIAWYEADLPENEEDEPFRNFQANFAKELPDETRWVMLMKLAKMSGASEGDLTPWIVAHQELESLSFLMIGISVSSLKK
ncbi:hypothetical protein BH11ARM2_BH11ARM2_19470 [soil metagenome]